MRRLAPALAASLAFLLVSRAPAPASAQGVTAPSAAPSPALAGVSIRRIEKRQPVPLVAHLVTIDLSKAGPVVVAADPAPDGEGFVASTVRELAARHGLVVAVNASFFEVPKGRYPAAGERADAVGGLVLDGKRTGKTGTIGGLLDGAICFDAHAARVEKGFACAGARWGLATGPVLLWKGARAETASADAIFKSPRHPRTAAGVDAKGTTLWLLVVDGRQPGVSEGATLDDLKEILKDAGATDAVNLDGGGSSTLVQRQPDGTYKVLNIPIHDRVPGCERPVVSAVGVAGAP